MDVVAVISPEKTRVGQWVPMLIGIVLFAGASLWAGLTSEGFLEADGCTHYLYARFAFEEPHYFVNIWGRPLKTMLYAAPAYFGGLPAVRITSLILALACALITYRIAALQGCRWPALAFIFVLAQPLMFLHSFSELTELPFATLLAGAFWAYQKRKFWVVALLIGLSPMSRPEGFGFLMLVGALLVLHRSWWPMLILPLPLVGWHIWGWYAFGQQGEVWRWLIDNWPYAATSTYASGSILHFVALLPTVTGPFVFPATLVGMWLCMKHFRCSIFNFGPSSKSRIENPKSKIAEDDSHRLRCDLLIVAIPLMILAGHSVLYFLGKMASNGELRYLLIVAPFWGLLGARGWEWLWQRFDWRHPFAWAGLAALLPASINFKFELPAGYTFGYKVLPLVLHEDWQTARNVARWYRESGIDKEYPYIAASHPGIFYFLDLSPAGQHVREWRPGEFGNPPPKTLLIVDPIYAQYNADAKRVLDPASLKNWRYLGVMNENVTSPDPNSQFAGFHLYASD
jgi:hypothetical protein